LGNEAKARAFLMKEWNAVKADINEPLSDPICPNGKMIRINLRPYKALHGDLETLWIALIESAKITSNNPDFIKTLWGQFKDSCKNQVFHFDPKDLVLFDKKLEKRNYPVMHHSKIYREKYHPAYRVIHNETMRDTLLKMQK
jgi:hypothetical protein